MVSKHAAGAPWAVRDGDVVDCRGDIVTRWPSGRSDAEACVNLIAAAPGLLAALKDVLRLQPEHTCAETFERAAAAIAKAEGR